MSKTRNWGEQEWARARQAIKDYYQSERDIPFSAFIYTPLGFPPSEAIVTATLPDGTEEHLVIEMTPNGNIIVHPM